MKLPIESAQVAAWASAFLAGVVAPDDVADQVVDGSRVHRVVGPDGEAASVALALAELRAAGARRAWLVWPEPGLSDGLPGPAGANRLALEAGQAVVLDPGGTDPGWLLVPSQLGTSGVLWTMLHADRPAAAATSMADAERALRAAIRGSTDLLEALDVGRTAPDDEARVDALRRRPPPVVLPSGFEPRARALLDTSQRLAGLLDVARGTDGAAVSRSEADRRADVLRELLQRVRDAFVASINSLAEDRTRAR